MWIDKIRAKRKRRFVPADTDKLYADKIQSDAERTVSAEEPQAASTADNVITCKKCGAVISKAQTAASRYVCQKCGYYFRVRTKNRIRMVVDAGTFEPWFEDIAETNPLDFPGYEEKLISVQEKTGLKESITIGYARIDGEPVVVGVCDSRFLMGSMGHVVGEKITLAVEKASSMRLPVILFCCSGGARM